MVMGEGLEGLQSSLDTTCDSPKTTTEILDMNQVKENRLRANCLKQTPELY